MIGATGDKLARVWYTVTMSIVSLLGTLATRIPAGRGMGSDTVS